MRLLAIGKAGIGPEAELFSRYAARIRPSLTLAEFSPGQGSVAEIKRREADALLGALSAAGFRRSRSIPAGRRPIARNWPGCWHAGPKPGKNWRF